MKPHVLAAAAVACSLALAGCQTRFDNSAAWGQIATGVGTIIGQTDIDPQVGKVSARLAKHCTELQAAAFAVHLYAPDKLQEAARNGRLALASFCASPPSNVAEAIAGVARAYAAIAAAQPQEG